MAEEQRSIQASPAFTTGGGGFAFEDEAGAWALSAMLAGQPIEPIGIPSVLAFQQKAPRAPLDDLVITGRGDEDARLYLSIKSFDILAGGKRQEFAREAWLQLAQESFLIDRDFVGFVTGQGNEPALKSVRKLITAARNDDPERLARAVAEPGAFNETDRELWADLACPGDLAEALDVVPEASSGTLLARLVAIDLDFRDPDSRSRTEALDWCEQALATGHAAQSAALYDAAYRLVASVRTSGGSIDSTRIAHRLGRRFPLATRPDAAPDWAILDRRTEERVDAVRDSLAGGLELPRAEATADLRGARAALVYVTGPSGCGKTALAKRWLGEGSGSRLWLSARDLADGLEDFRVRAGLRLPLTEIIAHGQAPVRVVIDGLDRLYEPAASAAAGQIAEALDSADDCLLITAQSFSLDRIARAVVRPGVPAHETVMVRDLDDADVNVVVAERPTLHRLASQEQLRGVLRRPKLLEVVFEALAHASDVTLVEVTDEAAVADLWWEHLAVCGEETAARGELLRRLACHLGDRLIAELPAGRLAEANADAFVGQVEGLRGDGILEGGTENFTFAHDLFGDWSRYRTLGDWTTAEHEMQARAPLPSWHRAIRLYALRILREEGDDVWASRHERLRATGNEVAADLFLDAPLFADNAEIKIEGLLATLFAEQGRLLRRLLIRFAHLASVPDPRALIVGTGVDPELATYLAAGWRIPIWVLWPPILSVLATHADEVVDCAPLEVALIVERWLRVAPTSAAGSSDAAQLALALGRFAGEAYDRSRYFDEDETKKLWRAFLAGGGVLPAEVTELALATLADGEDLDNDLDEDLL